MSVDRVLPIRWHAELRQWFLYLPAGVDPHDGAPMVAAIALLPDEAILHQQGRHDRLAVALRRRGVPLPPAEAEPGLLRRFLRRLRRFLGRG